MWSGMKIQRFRVKCFLLDVPTISATFHSERADAPGLRYSALHDTVCRVRFWTEMKRGTSDSYMYVCVYVYIAAHCRHAHLSGVLCRLMKCEIGCWHSLCPIRIHIFHSFLSRLSFSASFQLSRVRIENESFDVVAAGDFCFLWFRLPRRALF